MKILIPNATGPSNPGDQVMLFSLLDLIKKSLPSATVTVHSTDLPKYKNFSYRLRNNLYSEVLLVEKNNLVRLMRLGRLSYYLILLQTGLFKNIQHRNEIFSLINDYQDADLIVFVGGGCWRSRPGMKQILNLALLLMVVQIAKKSPSRKIMAPISFGPFAYDWQKNLSAGIMSGFDLVTAREKLSFDLMKKLGIRNLKLSCDHGLLLEKNQKVTVQENLVGFTIRNWSKDLKAQTALEQAYVESLAKLQQKYNLTVLPIVQVSLPGFPFEDDSLAVNRVYASLKERKVKVLKPVIIGDVKNAMKVYSELELVLGMRMHSNIIAATQGVPFVAVSYEHKTEGIAKQLSMSQFCLRYDQVDGKNLFEILERAYEQRCLIKEVLSQRLKIIKSREEKRWLKIFKAEGL